MSDPGVASTTCSLEDSAINISSRPAASSGSAVRPEPLALAAARDPPPGHHGNAGPGEHSELPAAFTQQSCHLGGGRSAAASMGEHPPVTPRATDRSLAAVSVTDRHTADLSRSNTSRSLLRGTLTSSPSAADAMSKKPGTRHGRVRRQSAVLSLAAGSAIKNAAHASYSSTNSPWVLFPTGRLYMAWWYITIILAVLNAWITPFALAFKAYPGLYPLLDLWSFLDIASVTAFTVDMVLKCFTAYFNPRTNMMVTDLEEIRSNYMRGLFWIDFVATFPFDWPILMTLGLNSSDSNTARYIALLKLFRLIRLYRLIEFFDFIEYNMILGQITLMLIRNITYIIYVTHWAGCLIWFIARSEAFAVDRSWVGRHIERFESVAITTKYIYSWYMMMASFTGMGDNDFYSNSVFESFFMICYQVVCLVLGAYILGSVTLLVVKGDERAAVLRGRVEAIKHYSGINDLPDNLFGAIMEHVELFFYSEQSCDAIILGNLPTTLRRRVLRHLYGSTMRECYLFAGCSNKFLDAIMAASHIENYMVGVQILSPGDVNNELSIIVSGTVETAVATMQAASQSDATFVSFAKDGLKDSYDNKPPLSSSSTRQNSGELSGATRSTQQVLLTTAQSFGEVSFFTEFPSSDFVTTQSVCKVMLVSRAAYAGLQNQFPEEARLVLENLQSNVSLVTQREILLAARASDIGVNMSEALSFTTSRRGGLKTPALKAKEQALLDSLHPMQAAALDHMRSVQMHVTNYCLKMDKERANVFLHAASSGEDDTVKLMLQKGLPVDSCDSERRTALVLAVRKGNMDVVELLLTAGADPQLRDAFGNTALFEACKSGADAMADLLTRNGATLNMEPLAVANHLCQCAHEGDLAFMRRLLKAGASADSADYDHRCALHISACEGNLPAVRVLVEEGDATLDFEDRWGNTALDEARRVGAAGVVAYLESFMDKLQALEGAEKWRHSRTTNFLTACSVGDCERIRFMLERSTPATLSTGIMLASARGHQRAVALLLAWCGGDLMSRTVGQAALMEAVCEGHDDVAALLCGRGASLVAVPSGSGSAGSVLVSAVVENALGTLRSLLKAGLGPELLDATQRTALHHAAELGHLDALRILTEEGGGRHDVPDGAGRTPLDVARAAGVGGRTIEYLEWAATVTSGRDRAQATLRFGVVRTALERARFDATVARHAAAEAGGAAAPSTSRRRVVQHRVSSLRNLHAKPARASMDEQPPSSETEDEAPTAVGTASSGLHATRDDNGAAAGGVEDSGVGDAPTNTVSGNTWAALAGDSLTERIAALAPVSSQLAKELPITAATAAAQTPRADTPPVRRDNSRTPLLAPDSPLGTPRSRQDSPAPLLGSVSGSTRTPPVLSLSSSLEPSTAAGGASSPASPRPQAPFTRLASTALGGSPGASRPVTPATSTSPPPTAASPGPPGSLRMATEREMGTGHHALLRPNTSSSLLGGGLDGDSTARSSFSRRSSLAPSGFAIAGGAEGGGGMGGTPVLRGGTGASYSRRASLQPGRIVPAVMPHEAGASGGGTGRVTPGPGCGLLDAGPLLGAAAADTTAWRVVSPSGEPLVRVSAAGAHSPAPGRPGGNQSALDAAFGMDLASLLQEVDDISATVGGTL